MSRLLVRNAEFVVTMNQTREIVANGSISIQDGEIVRVEKSSPRESEQDYDRVIDARGKVVTPGLVDAHCHNLQHLCRGLANEADIQTFLYARLYPYESSLTPEDAYWSAMSSQLELLKSGTTCVVDPGSYWPEAMVAAMEETGIRGVVARSAFDLGSSHLGSLPSQVFNEGIDAALSKGEAFVTKYDGALNGRVSAWLQLRVLSNCSDDLCRALKSMTDDLDVGIEAHASFTKEVFEASKFSYGKTDVQRLYDLECLGETMLLAHMGWLTPNDMHLVADTETNVVLCCSSSFHQAMGSIAFGHVPELLAMGVPVSLGTDGGPHGTNDLVRQMFLASGGYKEIRLDATIMPPETAMEMATVHGAAAALQRETIGSLETGKKADLVLWDADSPQWRPLHDPVANLVYCATGSTADTVVVDGDIVMEGRTMTGVDEGRILRECQERSLAISKRAGLTEFSRPRWPVT